MILAAEFNMRPPDLWDLDFIDWLTFAQAHDEFVRLANERANKRR